MNKIISTDKAPKAIGPYSQAYQCGNTLYCSGQIAINPETDYHVLDPYLDQLDGILVMTVNPGFGGQSFINSSINKIAKIKDMIKGKNILIEVDGGINPLTAAECVAAGADILVAGSAILNNGDYKKNIEALR